MMKKKIAFISLPLMLMVSVLTSVSEVTVPNGYSEDVDLENSLVYTIEEADGPLEVFDFVTFQSTYYAIETGGSLEFDFIDFYNNEPYFNITFKYEDGTTNATIANVSNTQLALDLTLSIGYMLLAPGVYTNSSAKAWENSDTVLEDSIPADIWYNGTLKIIDEGSKHGYEYKQEVTRGAQNTTMIYNENTGLLQEATTEFGDYHLSIKLKGMGIPAYPSVSLMAVLLVSVASLILYATKRKNH